MLDLCVRSFQIETALASNDLPAPVSVSMRLRRSA
jgi:hypothetical protein